MTVARPSSCLPTLQETFCSKPAIALGVVIALAIAILGTLSLVGTLYPATPLGSLSSAIGQAGSYIMIGVSISAVIAIFVARHCCRSLKKEFNSLNTHENSPSGVSGAPRSSSGTTGAAARSGVHENVTFD